ncbi:hypothetical protein [Dactylosporangium sp. NPDC049140]|uniref:hypothetical protein n=1 Tax=Dactylosporangium sp. NPDC049140 TaxID=3155647 RepID=UPI0033F8059D
MRRGAAAVLLRTTSVAAGSCSEVARPPSMSSSSAPGGVRAVRLDVPRQGAAVLLAGAALPLLGAGRLVVKALRGMIRPRDH